MKYFIEIGTSNKAKADIDDICRKEGFVNLTKCNLGTGAVGRFFTKIVSILNILFYMGKGDILLLQYPVKKFYGMACRFAHIKGAKVITIIHDLGAFRRKKLTPEKENKLLNLSDFLIVHNDTMLKYVVEKGYKGGTHSLQIFDYLSEKAPADNTPHTPWRVVYAGNLARRKNEFLYNLATCMSKWEMDLYGGGFEEKDNSCKGLRYHGFIKSDDFISTVDGDFGLVWDGDSVNECTGPWGEYLRINNPHKTSFYLRAGLPVIVWSSAAMAGFVKEKNIGIIVDSIAQIDERLSNISAEEYMAMKNAAIEMSKKLSDGYYFKKGIKAGENYLTGAVDK